MAHRGEQLHVRHLTRDGGQDDKQLLAEQVAGYVARHATKNTEALGVTLDHRIGEVELEIWTCRVSRRGDPLPLDAWGVWRRTGP